MLPASDFCLMHLGADTSTVLGWRREARAHPASKSTVLPCKGLNIRIPIMIPMKGRGFMNQGSGLQLMHSGAERPHCIAAAVGFRARPLCRRVRTFLPCLKAQERLPSPQTFEVLGFRVHHVDPAG